MSFLYKDPDQVVALGGEDHLLKAHRSDKAAMGDPLEFDGLHRVGKGHGYLIHPRKGGAVAKSPTTDPISYLEPAGVHCGVPGNASYNDFPACSIDDVGVLPFLVLQVPDIFYSGAVSFGDGAPFTEAAYPKRVADHVSNEGVVENGLPKDLRTGCRFSLH